MNYYVNYYYNYQHSGKLKISFKTLKIVIKKISNQWYKIMMKKINNQWHTYSTWLMLEEFFQSENKIFQEKKCLCDVLQVWWEILDDISMNSFNMKELFSVKTKHIFG